MAVGWYSPAFDSAISPWTTLGPLAFVISISLLVEGSADRKRHANDKRMNDAPCVILQKASEITTHASLKKLLSKADASEIGYANIRRMDIRQGHFVLIQNREMIPADIVLLASANDQGSAYIETSSIDGETNLKLRLSAVGCGEQKESLQQAATRITQDSALCNKNGMILHTELPNPSVHTFQGKLEWNGQDIPLNAEHVLLRGAVLRNTEWALGLAFFTGDDTKLIQNSFATPFKFSVLDKLMNKTVLVILVIMVGCISYLSAFAYVANDRMHAELWYTGLNRNTTEVWPYLPDFEAPKWDPTPPNFLQYFFLYVTLLNNFIPLSLYVTVEFVTFCMLWFLYSDKDMYDPTTNTRATARATTITDLGRVQYIFSDKTGTLTQNVMRFKRCSVDGLAFGAPIKETRGSFLPLKQLLVGKVNMKDQSADKRLTWNTEWFLRVLALCHTVVVEKDLDQDETDDASVSSNKSAKNSKRAPVIRKSDNDGAPTGCAYQAESPDEGALVSAASRVYGFQVVGRDSSGIRLHVRTPSLLRDDKTTQALANGDVSLGQLAALSLAHGDNEDNNQATENEGTIREETWRILAVNKFDSDRKRMSILLQSPPELGSLYILFCKGADSAMLDIGVQDENNIETVLGIQAHLGEFAREGLRTLVLGVKVLTEQVAKDWMKSWQDASVALENRNGLLTQVAVEMEKDLHLVGATAIEDKLQRKVPETIATLMEAGLKLWVLTGDKRETAVEIGYATRVLTPQMHLTQVPDSEVVRTQMCMEFIRLVKNGQLPQFTMQQLNSGKADESLWKRLLYTVGKWNRKMKRSVSRCLATIYQILGLTNWAEAKREAVQASAEGDAMSRRERRRRVRDFADSTIRDYLRKHKDEDEVSLASEETPLVFSRASSAKERLSTLEDTVTLREASLAAHLTTSQEFVIEEDLLSVNSFLDQDQVQATYDKKRRTLLERWFAIDKQVRQGHLHKHVRPSVLVRQSTRNPDDVHNAENITTVGPRALVIEGAALKSLLGHNEMEQVLFSVASQCDAVIACRVSPQQKALLVNLVRQKVQPEPITLAIGDGANDVGMIQEAHVGVGISGKEGQQAVNASDFAISQFRFLETLLLIHGRWDFFRLSTVVLFSFYKNATMAGILILYTSRTVYSGTTFFDEWLIAMLNFVAAWPIITIGLFDRCLSKEYVRANPQVFRASRENELITTRVLMRWIILVFVHVFMLYFLIVPSMSFGAGQTEGRSRESRPGNGEGADLKSVGTVTYTCMILVLAYKVLLEARSWVHGRWPAWWNWKTEGILSRMAHTWIGVFFLSIGFYAFAIGIYQLLGRSGASDFVLFVDTPIHVFTQYTSWLLVALVPWACIFFDLFGKVMGNLWYPTQTQIHLELQSQAKIKARRSRGIGPFRRRIHHPTTEEEQGNDGAATDQGFEVENI